jgi:penicillin-binding protein 1A
LDEDGSSVSPIKPAHADEAVKHQADGLKSGRAFREFSHAFLDDLRAVYRRGAGWLLGRLKRIRVQGQKRQLPTLRAMRDRLSNMSATLFVRSSSSISQTDRVRIWRRPARYFRSWKAWITVALVACMIVTAGVMTWALKDVPWEEIAHGSIKPSIVLEMSDGTPLVRHCPFQGAYAEYNEFPAQLIDAVLSIEDRRFLDHHGIDLKGIARAFIRNFRRVRLSRVAVRSRNNLSRYSTLIAIGL